jgi:thiamine biosynthesis lipoprotein
LREPDGEIVRLAAPAMGTRFEIALAGGERSRLRAAGEAALEEIQAMSRRLSRFDAGSLVWRINEQAPHRQVRVDPDTLALLRRCVEARRATGGAFDVTAALSAGSPPDSVRLDEGAMAVRLHPAARLDLGGIAKGWALDAAAGLLREAGVSCALLHGGTSSVLAIGAPPGAKGWGVALGQGPSWPVLVLRDAAMSVSAPHGRTIQTPLGPGAHILDPRSGEPSLGAVLACTACPSATDAEVWSTALVVLGERPSGMPWQVASIIAQGKLAQPRWAVHDPYDMVAWPAGRLKSVLGATPEPAGWPCSDSLAEQGPRAHATMGAL